MKSNPIFAAAAMIGLMAAVTPVFAQGADEVSAQAVITVLGKNNEAAAPVQERISKFRSAASQPTSRI